MFVVCGSAGELVHSEDSREMTICLTHFHRRIASNAVTLHSISHVTCAVSCGEAGGYTSANFNERDKECECIKEPMQLLKLEFNPIFTHLSLDCLEHEQGTTVTRSLLVFFIRFVQV